MDQQVFYVHSLTTSSLRLGPYHCSAGVEIADHLPQLLKDKLPSTKDRVFVVVYPCVSCSSICHSSSDSASVYELLLDPEERRVSLDDVRNQLCACYGRDLLEEETLCVWTATGDLEQYCKYI